MRVQNKTFHTISKLLHNRQGLAVGKTQVNSEQMEEAISENDTLTGSGEDADSANEKEAYHELMDVTNAVAGLKRWRRLF